MNTWTPSRAVWIALALSLALWLGVANVAFGQGVAFSGPDETNGVDVLLVCQENDGNPRCALTHVRSRGTVDEEWVMGAGPMDVPYDAPPGGFCLTADVSYFGDETGPLGPVPALLGRRACFIYDPENRELVFPQGTNPPVILTPDPELWEQVEAVGQTDSGRRQT